MNFSVTTLTPDDGLSQGSNYFRYEDSQGFMWITANDAINRFDGKNIKVYKKDYYFDNCKNLQQGYGFAEDDRHNIYIGSPNGLYVYLRQKDRFNLKLVLPKEKDQMVIPIGFAQGKIWCHNKDFDIIAYDIKTNTSKVYSTSSSYKVASFHVYDNNLNPMFQRLPFIDIHGNIWIINPNGLLFFDTKTNKVTRYLEKQLIEKKLKILSSSYDKFKNEILLGVDNSLLIYHCSSGTMEIIKKNSRVESVAVNKNLIVIRDKEYFEIFDKDFKKLYSQKLDENVITSYSYSFDKRNRLWLCRDGFGQIIFDFKPPFLNKILGNNSFFETGIGNFSEFADGTFLVQDDVLFDKEKKQLKKLTGNSNVGQVIKNVTDIKQKVIWQLVQKSDQKITLYQLDERKKIELYFKFPRIPEIGILQDVVVVNDQLLCSFQSGLYLMNTKEKTLKKLENQTKKNPFKINRISKNRIIVSYLNQEATVYTLDDELNILFSKNIVKGLQSFYFEEDAARNVLWVGTNNGILVLNSNFEIIKKIDANNNLAGTYIYGILLDKEGNCWTSHQRGLSFINRKSYTIINFTKEDGIQDWDFNNRSYYRATDGTLFFGGMMGFNYFKPPLISHSFYKPQVYIDEILVNAKPFELTKNNDCIEKLDLDFKQNNITIKALVKDLESANSRELIYRIKEITTKWKHLPNGASIYFANLAPNEYTLQLGYYDKFNNKEVFQKTLLISISAPFYYKIWFWSTVAFLLSSMFFYFYSKRKLAIQKRIFQQQLALEQQRNKITADLHDEIGSTLSSLQINSTVANQMLDRKSVDIKIVLQKIEQQSELLSDKIGDIIWSMKPGKEEFLPLSSRLKNYANDILGATNADYTITIDEKIDYKITDITTRKNILLFCKEAINNAAKYSKATLLTVDIKVENNTVCIVIADNGIGFDSTKINGNGIGNMQNRIKELQGQCEINSQPNSGTTISATFPFIP